MIRSLRIQGLLVSFLLLFSVGWAADGQRGLSVQVREGQLRNAPSFLGKIVAKPSYGERVALLQEQGDWRKVTLSSGLQGWMHASALTAKTIVLRAGAANVPTSATGGEIALAGKGFSEEVEKQYKSLNRNLDYGWVDRMERVQISPEEMQTFLREGELVPQEGGLR
ncbi:MAG: SH3 domain-containing protein [Deltaproteobacteria bacterium]|nr:SH3 domain-containing protein [Deltaproteobacteria bacterium]